MAYTASALSFMFENLAKPVVLTGSILPLGEVHSDGRRNLAVSIVVAGVSCVPEVCIFFNDRLLRGNRATKISSSGVAAFDSPNFPPLATLGVDIHFNESVIAAAPRGRLAVHKTLDCGILVLRLVPGFIDLEELHTSSTKLKAVVLLLYGTGNAPSRKKSFLEWIKRMIENKVHVVAVSQCMTGATDLEKYEVGLQLTELGVIAASDMTCEAAVTKLAYLIGRGLSSKQLGMAMETPLRGEMMSGREIHFQRETGGLMSKL